MFWHRKRQRALSENGCEVVEVDWDGMFDPARVVDITTWDYTVYPHDHFDVIWCSPACTQYSRARTKAKTPRKNKEADKLVWACLRIVEHFRPTCWFLENPDSGATEDQGRCETFGFCES